MNPKGLWIIFSSNGSRSFKIISYFHAEIKSKGEAKKTTHPPMFLIGQKVGSSMNIRYYWSLKDRVFFKASDNQKLENLKPLSFSSYFQIFGIDTSQLKAPTGPNTGLVLKESFQTVFKKMEKLQVL